MLEGEVSRLKHKDPLRQVEIKEADVEYGQAGKQIGYLNTLRTSNMATILQTTFSNAFFSMKLYFESNFIEIYS